MAYTIALSTNTLTKDAIMATDYSGDEVSVIVDGNEGMTNFEYLCEYSWITVDRTVNPVVVRVSDNDDMLSRDGYVAFYHKSDESVVAILEITQNGEERSITLSNSSITNMKLLSDDVRTITVTVVGGRKKFYVKSINKYNSSGKRLSYDGVFAISIENSGDGVYWLVLSTYGSISSTSGCYYDIILTHMDERSINETIRVSFTEVSSAYILPDIPTYDTLTASEISTASMMFSNISDNGIQLSSIDIAEEVYPEVIEESIRIVVNDVENPTTIDISGSESINVYVYTVIDNKGVAETDSAIMFKLSGNWAKISLNKELTTLDYKVLTITKTKDNPYGFERKMLLTITNAERPLQKARVSLLQQAKN